MSNVVPVAEARNGLSRTLRAFRADPAANAVVIGSHRKPEAVLMPVAAFERLAAEPSGVSLDTLRSFAPIIVKLATAANLADVRVYGSVARGEQTGTSDVDLLVSPLEGSTLFDIAQFEIDLELLLGTKVSATPIAALDADSDSEILRESVAL
ncbi:nucleotidyltransferase domain-containing protein [Microbacterium sp. BR1]|uniref:nucleotidyltransferase domain-containing protein n=1 Tax=Microbacterium sp. BR1 TaxID=1070896 RepID=UPI0018E27AFC|nr:nucleotidyltransferase domain-containing protein [Microbacterium sp. BR1]